MNNPLGILQSTGKAARGFTQLIIIFNSGQRMYAYTDSRNEEELMGGYFEGEISFLQFYDIDSERWLLRVSQIAGLLVSHHGVASTTAEANMMCMVEDNKQQVEAATALKLPIMPVEQAHRNDEFEIIGEESLEESQSKKDRPH